MTRLPYRTSHRINHQRQTAQQWNPENEENRNQFVSHKHPVSVDPPGATVVPTGSPVMLWIGRGA